jgi:hypothetical protein
MAMKFHLLRTAALAVSVVLIAWPGLSRTEYMGGGFLTDFTAPCIAVGWPTHHQVVVRSLPAGLPENHPTDHMLNIFAGNFVMHYRFANSPYSSGGWSTATYASIGRLLDLDPAGIPRVRRLTTPVGTVLGSDDAEHLTFEIENFAGEVGCTVRGNVWMYRR